MKLTVNGEPMAFEKDKLSVTDLLHEKSVATPEMVSVQLNGKILNKCSYPHANLKDGDTVDFLYFMGGGSR